MHESSVTRESMLRSAAKAVSYRLMGTLTTMAVTFAVTGEAATALAVGGLEPGLKLLVYYLHERAWQRVPVGTMLRLGRRVRSLAVSGTTSANLDVSAETSE